MYVLIYTLNPLKYKQLYNQGETNLHKENVNIHIFFFILTQIFFSTVALYLLYTQRDVMGRKQPQPFSGRSFRWCLTFTLLPFDYRSACKYRQVSNSGSLVPPLQYVVVVVIFHVTQSSMSHCWSTDRKRGLHLVLSYLFLIAGRYLRKKQRTSFSDSAITL